MSKVQRPTSNVECGLQRPTSNVDAAWRLCALAVLSALLVAPEFARPASAQGRKGTPAGPSLQFNEASGCGALLLYTWNEARTEVLVIRIDQSQVKIKDGSTDLEIGPAGSPVTAELELSDAARDSFPYCEEGAKPTEKLVIWKALSGRVKVIVKRRPKAPFTPVNIGVDRLLVQGPNGEQVKQRRDIQFTAAISEVK